jgi:hypothetical protein
VQSGRRTSSALALDLLSEEGGTDAPPDDMARMAALNAAALTPERFDTDLRSNQPSVRR